MAKSLIVVESPTKARTLSRYLGRGFEVKASGGHVKDLPKNEMGVNIADDFSPNYRVLVGKGKVLKELAESAASSEGIYLAPDPDREGEAIAWHIAQELIKRGVPEENIYRVLFNEITESAVTDALKKPSKLDARKYEAQQARRILDRLVGYKLSPLLWEKVKSGLSAGRVQSVAVRLICDREQEVRAFIPEEYWDISALLAAPSSPSPFHAKLATKGKTKTPLPHEDAVSEVFKGLRGCDFRVSEVKRRKSSKKPPPPFITSTLQQDAARKLGFTAKRTMGLAQRLYEGVKMGNAERVGLITYMRTDSFRVSKTAAQEARSYIEKNLGKEYLPKTSPVYRSKKSAQDAHEAIRPTSVFRTPREVSRHLDRPMARLYELIWLRFLASQVLPALYHKTQVDITAGEYLFRASGLRLVFDGFTRLYEPAKNAKDADEEERDLPHLEEGQELELHELDIEHHCTKPPPRYNEASLIKELEENGVGRPSTYASIIGTVQDKAYVKKEKKRFVPTELGMLVNSLLVQNFPDVLDVEFTARLESDLDKIEEGRASWLDIVASFYDRFHKEMELADAHMADFRGKGLPAEIPCPTCGSPTEIRWGKSGEFLACTGYPGCRFTSDFQRDEAGKMALPEPEEVPEETCEKCGSKMVVKRGPYGRFLACSGYPECRNTRSLSGAAKVPQEETGVPCPEDGCRGSLVARRYRNRVFYGCSNYPKCRFTTSKKPLPKACPECGHTFLVKKKAKGKKAVLACPKKGCSYQEPLGRDGGDP